MGKNEKVVVIIWGFSWGTDLGVHFDQVKKDYIFPLHFDGFVKRILCFGFDHLVQELCAHGAEIFLPQVVLKTGHETQQSVKHR